MGVLKERIEWVKRFESSKTWINAIMVDRSGSKYTLKEYSNILWKFCQWANMNPDQFIELAKKDRRKIEDMCRTFILEFERKSKVKRNTLRKYVAVLRSFFGFHEVRLRVKQPKAVAEPLKPHTLEEIKTLLNFADIRERALILLLKDSGMSREDVVRLKYSHIRRELEAGKEIIHIRAVRQKEKVPYDTFIGRNAIEALKAYLEYRRNKGETIDDETPLIASKGGRPISPEAISTIFQRLSRKSGIKTSAHRFRKTFESYLGLSAPSLLVKYWMGHSLGVETSYFIPPLEKQREKYRKAYFQIDVFKEEVSEVERRKQQMLDMAKLMGWDDEKLKAFEKFLETCITPKQLETAINEFLKTYRKEDCQQIVNEDELEEYLQKGWHIEAVLPSGRIVVSNE